MKTLKNASKILVTLLALSLLSSALLAQQSTMAEVAYQNAVNSPPAGWIGPTFQLSADYPIALPTENPQTTLPWFNVDLSFPSAPPSTQATWGNPWNAYIMALLEYVKQGQDPQLRNENGWNADVNGETRWFHVPWMAYRKASGREFVHGCTNERTATLGDLIGPVRVGRHGLPGTKEQFESWAFGVYNPWGGYTLGQVWRPDGTPRIVQDNMGTNQVQGLPFPTGTMVVKLLFTTATPADAPFLKGSPEWTVHGHKYSGDAKDAAKEKREGYPRALIKVRLTQMDVAAVDPRAPWRWVFGTFVYKHKHGAKDAWESMRPVGLMWGADPNSFPAVPKAGAVPAYQSVLNHDIGYEHYGVNGRLNGPVDNPSSGCLACHGGAYAAPAGTEGKTPPIFGFSDGQMGQRFNMENMVYFQNYPWPAKYPGYPDAIHLDTSLQLQVAFRQYGIFLSTYED